MYCIDSAFGICDAQHRDQLGASMGMSISIMGMVGEGLQDALSSCLAVQ